MVTSIDPVTEKSLVQIPEPTSWKICQLSLSKTLNPNCSCKSLWIRVSAILCKCNSLPGPGWQRACVNVPISLWFLCGNLVEVWRDDQCFVTPLLCHLHSFRHGQAQQHRHTAHNLRMGRDGNTSKYVRSYRTNEQCWNLSTNRLNKNHWTETVQFFLFRSIKWIKLSKSDVTLHCTNKYIRDDATKEFFVYEIN